MESKRKEDVVDIESEVKIHAQSMLKIAEFRLCGLIIKGRWEIHDIIRGVVAEIKKQKKKP